MRSSISSSGAGKGARRRSRPGAVAAGAGREDRQNYLGKTDLGKAHREAHMSARLNGGRASTTERLAILEQKVSHVESELSRMSAKVDEMHAILLQAKGVRWAVIAVSGLVGFLTGISHWLISKA
jgi:hypothetical protein